MAKLTMTLDTEDQTMTIDVDGQTVANVNEVNVANWGSGDDPKFSFYVTTYEKVGGVHRMTRLMAQESPEAREALADGTAKASASLPGFLEVPAKSKAQEQISAWFKSTRR
jgi:hypothetical protein